MKAALIVAIAAVATSASASTELTSTPSTFTPPMIESRIELHALELDIDPTALATRAFQSAREVLGVEGQGFSRTPGGTAADRPLPRHQVIIIESARGVHLIERAPVDSHR